jgi:hypothetical protein
VTLYGRRYGDKESHPIYIWNGILEPKHLKRLGSAFPLFVWLIDRTTKEHNGIGVVLGGKPLKAEEIAVSMGVYEQTIRRHLDRLEQHGYIERTLTPHGYTIRIRKSCKFTKRSTVVVQDRPTTQGTRSARLPDLPMQECPTSPCKTARRNKSKQLEEAVEEAAAAPSDLWIETGIDPLSVPGPFRKIAQNLWPTRNGASLFDFMGVVLDGWQALGSRSYPPAWVKRKAELRTNGYRLQPMRDLEDPLACESELRP